MSDTDVIMAGGIGFYLFLTETESGKKLWKAFWWGWHNGHEDYDAEQREYEEAGATNFAPW